MKKIIVFVSGNGSNLQSIIDSIESGVLKAEIPLVVGNRAGINALNRAKGHNIPTICKPFHEKKQTREEYDRELAEEALQYEPDLIVLAGWLHIFTSSFLDYFPKRVINLHPALPGMFPGKYAISRAYMAFKRGEIGGTGVMVHRVTLEVDAGKCILFKKVKIYEKDSIRNLEDRMHQVEHELLIRAIKRLFRPPSRPKTAKKGAKSSEKRRKSTKKSQFWHKINEKQQKRGQNQRKAAKNGEKGVKSIKVNRNQRKTGQNSRK